MIQNKYDSFVWIKYMNIQAELVRGPRGYTVLGQLERSEKKSLFEFKSLFVTFFYAKTKIITQRHVVWEKTL